MNEMCACNIFLTVSLLRLLRFIPCSLATEISNYCGQGYTNSVNECANRDTLTVPFFSISMHCSVFHIFYPMCSKLPHHYELVRVCVCMALSYFVLIFPVLSAALNVHV